MPSPPTYGWLDTNLDQRSNADFVKQYSEFCKQRGIEYDGLPYLSEHKFEYEPPADNASFAEMSHFSCDAPILPGSLRKLPDVPIEVPWNSAEHFEPKKSGPNPHQHGANLSSDPNHVAGASIPIDDGYVAQDNLVSGAAPFGKGPVSENFTNNTVLNWSDQRDLPNVFQVRSGILQGTLPSRNGAGQPFNGLFNTLSQAYDLNITPRDMHPEAFDPRFIPTDPDDSNAATVADLFAPDTLFQSSNRFTSIEGVTQDPVTGAIMIHYGQDVRPDYKGKIYDSPPVVNIGAPNKLLDYFTNTGVVPQTRGQGMILKPRVNDIQPAVSPFAQAHTSLATRAYAQQQGSRAFLNTRTDNTAPLDSSANKNNPANQFNQYGTFGIRALMETGNIVKTINPDALGPVDLSRPGNYAGIQQPGQKNIETPNFFYRRPEDYDVPSTVQATTARETQVNPGIDAQGYGNSSTIANSTPYFRSSQTVGAPTNTIDAQGFVNSSQVYEPRYSFDQVSGQSAPQMFDAQGSTNASMLQGSMTQPLAQTVAVPTQFDAQGYGHSQTVLHHYSKDIGVPMFERPSMHDAQGKTNTSVHSLYRPQNIGQEHHVKHMTDAQAYIETSKPVHARHRHEEFASNYHSMVDPMAKTDAGVKPTHRVSHSMQEMHVNSPVDAMGKQASQTMPVYRASTMEQQSIPTMVDGQGMIQSAQVVQNRSYALDGSQTVPQTIDAQGMTVSATAPLPLRQVASTQPSNPSVIDPQGYTNSTIDASLARYADPRNIGTSSGVQAEQSRNLQIKHQMYDWEYQTGKQDTQTMVNQTFGGPTYETPEVIDPTVQAWNAAALAFSQTPGEKMVFSDVVHSVERTKARNAGASAFNAMVERDMSRGKTTLLNQGIVGLTASPSTPGSPSPPGLDAYVYGARQ